MSAGVPAVCVPKAAVYENYCEVFGENYVGLAGVVFVTDAVTEACLKECGPNLLFRLGIL